VKRPIEEVIVPGFDVFNPRVLEAIRDAVFAFCKVTNDTALTDVATAQQQLRQELSQGLEAGESLARLTARVGGIFRDPAKALMIAATESSRALHAGQAMAARESGVCSGLRWLASSDACDLCSPLDGKEVAFGEAFFVASRGGPYARVEHPPRHPHCMCTTTEVLDISDRTPPPPPPPVPTPEVTRPIKPARPAPAQPATPKPPKPPTPSREVIRPQTPQELKKSLAVYKPGNEAVKKAKAVAEKRQQLFETHQAKLNDFAEAAERSFHADIALEKDRRNAQLREQAKQLRQEMQRAHKISVKAEAEFYRHVETTRDQVIQAIAKQQLAGTQVTAPATVSSAIMEKVGEAAKFFGATLAADGYRAGVPLGIIVNEIPSTDEQRAFYIGGSIHLTGSSSTATAIHEIGHKLEEYASGVHEAVLRFQELRFGDEAPQSLAALFPDAGYGPQEMGRKDKMEEAFGSRHAYYVGKSYSDNSEIVSMGLQKLYEDPTGFAAKDPEYFKFCVAILRGDLQK
jgi:Phage Mu protein F like protein